MHYWIHAFILIVLVSADHGLRKGRDLAAANTQYQVDERDPANRFNIKLVNVGWNKDYDDLMAEAAARWEEVIVGDLEDIPAQANPNFDWFDRSFGPWIEPYNEPIDDVVIGYAFRPKTFFGNTTDTLGHASTLYVRNFDHARMAPPMTAISGVMEFNKDAILESDYTRNDLKAIILHEMAHVLGIGGDFWSSNCARDCLHQWYHYGGDGNFQLGDDAYRCVNAQKAYYELGLKPTHNRGERLLVNQVGDLGNVCGHWAGQSFRVPGVTSEIMTPFFEAGVAQPLSTVTIGALQDIGYNVNYEAADDFPAAALMPDAQRRLKKGNRQHTALAPEHSFDLSRLMNHHQPQVHANVIVISPSQHGHG